MSPIEIIEYAKDFRCCINNIVCQFDVGPARPDEGIEFDNELALNASALASQACVLLDFVRDQGLFYPLHAAENLESLLQAGPAFLLDDDNRTTLFDIVTSVVGKAGMLSMLEPEIDLDSLLVTIEKTFVGMDTWEVASIEGTRPDVAWCKLGPLLSEVLVFGERSGADVRRIRETILSNGNPEITLDETHDWLNPAKAEIYEIRRIIWERKAQVKLFGAHCQPKDVGRGADGEPESSGNFNEIVRAEPANGSPALASLPLPRERDVAKIIERIIEGPRTDVDQPAPKADGPHPPTEFWYGGKSVSLPPIPFALLDFVWKQDGRTCEVTAAIEAAWGDSNGSGPSDNAVHAAAGKIREAFTRIGCKLSLAQKAGFFAIS